MSLLIKIDDGSLSPAWTLHTKNSGMNRVLAALAAASFHLPRNTIHGTCGNALPAQSPKLNTQKCSATKMIGEVHIACADEGDGAGAG